MSDNEYKELRLEAKAHLLNAIVAFPNPASRSKSMRNLAEAWAFLESPDQPHGGYSEAN